MSALARHVVKSRKVTLASPKVMGAHVLNFGPIFEYIIVKKFLGILPSWVSVG